MEAKTKRILILSLIIMIGLLIVYPAILLYVTQGGGNTTLFGELFVALYTAFSAAAFLLLIITVFIQKEELKLQRHEIELIKKESINQNETLVKQQFENTFFNLIKMQRNIVQNFKYKENEKEIQGESVFNVLYEELKRANTRVFENSQQKDWNLISPVDVFDSFFNANGQLLKPYFSNIISILNLVEDKCPGSKEFYFEILESQILNSQKTFLLYYLAWKSNPASTSLIKRAKIITHSDLTKVVQPEHAQKIESIFGRHDISLNENQLTEQTIQLSAIPGAKNKSTSLY